MKCPNCKAPIERIDGYCWNCGQKNKEGLITLKEFFQDVLTNVLNIDAKIFRTLGHLFIPGKLSRRYFAGQRQQYFSPFRLFFVSAILFFAIVSYFGAQDMQEEGTEDFLGNEIQRKGQWEVFRHELDTARQNVIKQFPNEPVVPLAMDSLLAEIPDYSSNLRYFSYFHLNEKGEIKSKRVEFSYEELVRYSPRELVKRGNVEGWIGKIQVQQSIKLNKDGKSFILFLIKNMLWMAIVMMAALALTLKLLYIRRKRYLIEHLVFAFHYHSFSFIIFSVAILLGEWIDSESFIGFSFLAVMIYLFIAMRRFYQQGIFKTFVKFNILNFSYLFIFVLFITLTFVVSAFIF